VTYAYPVIGHLPVADIDRGLVKQVLAPIWNTKTKSAKDLRGRISKILGWAIAEGWREPPNPAAWGENLEHNFPRPGTIAPPKPFAALSYKDVPAFMARLRKDDRIAARALEFLILCASRTGEVRFAKWSEINWDERTWTIPKARMKMRRNAWVEDHTVPLSDPPLGILMALKGDGEPDPNAYIFAASDASHAPGAQIMLRVLQKIWPENPDLSVHGFRSCFADWAGDCTAVDEEVREFALAHVKRGVSARYRRKTALEKRAALMQQWSSYCEGGNIIPLERRA
jgi:integrase